MRKICLIATATLPDHDATHRPTTPLIIQHTTWAKVGKPVGIPASDLTLGVGVGIGVSAGSYQFGSGVRRSFENARQYTTSLAFHILINGFF